MNTKAIFTLSSLLILAMSSGCVQQPVSGNAAYNVANGAVSYSDRPKPDFTISFFNETAYANISRVAYRSRDAVIYALLAIPKTGGNHPAFVLLPAQSIPKEVEQEWLGSKLNGMGYATLSLDQRGQGETKAATTGLQEDFQAYSEGRETGQSKMVYDALAAYDILASMPGVDTSRIYMEGESMGGRFAVIASYIEPKIRGLLLISTSGYGLPDSGSEEVMGYQKYIDPDNYIGKIAPRKILMVHAADDWVIPADMAKRTFSHANEPKKFILVDAKFHGYYNIAETSLPKVLEENVNGWLLA